MEILIDRREQLPYAFTGYAIERAFVTLPTGDYSIRGAEKHIALERKELGELVHCLSHARQRFERELAHAAGMTYFAVVIEASMDDVMQHRYRSQMKPAAVMQSCFALGVRYGVHFLWCGSRPQAEYAVHSILEKYTREQAWEVCV